MRQRCSRSETSHHSASSWSSSRRITTAPKPKTQVKLSQQTQFVLEAMDTAKKKEDMHWEKKQERISLLFEKLEKQDTAQQQIVAQMGLIAQAIAQSSADHTELAQ
jgi:hypothetical protein